MCTEQKILEAFEKASMQIGRSLPEKDESFQFAMNDVANFGKKFTEQHENDFQAQRKRVCEQLSSGMRRTHADPV